MAIKHEGEAVDQIMDFFQKNGVAIDESRKRNLVRHVSSERRHVLMDSKPRLISRAT
jgi:hypothetical protein